MNSDRENVDFSDLVLRVSIFEGLSLDEARRLGRRLKVVSYPKDTVIVSHEELGDTLFIIRSGRVKVVLYGDNGREVILSSFKEGDFFGEMTMLDGRPRSANVISTEPTEALVLAREDFVNHLRDTPETALKILAEMSIRLRRADEVIGNLALLDVYGRVARTLLDLAEREGEDTDEGILIRERPTQQHLASMIGTSRETVSRVLSEFQRRGFLSMHGKNILLSHGFDAQELS